MLISLFLFIMYNLNEKSKKTEMINQNLSYGKHYPYNQAASIIDYIRETAKNNLEKTALVDDSSRLSYEEIFSFADNLAAQLGLLGLEKSDNVVIFIPTSNYLIILIFAILINGSNYTVIDSNCPNERLQYILKNNQAKFLIIDKVLAQEVDLGDTKIILHKDLLKPHAPIQNQNFIYSPAEGSDCAYIIYTSGSTGQPKGISISHSSVNNHMLWMADQFKLMKTDTFLLKTALTFDASVWEIFLSFYVGGTLFIGETGSHANPEKLISYIEKYNITVLQLVPVVLTQILNLDQINKLRTLRYIFVGGESLSKKTKQSFFSKNFCCNLVNLYGPAEATIDTTFHIVMNTEDDIENDYIGNPIYNTEVHVINDESKICQSNETGELYIGGNSLAIGYLQKDLTEKSFIEMSINKEKVRLYKTGDLVVWQNDKLKYCGRKDKQIKLNGVRIETEEIKNVIQNYGGILDCLFECEINPVYQYKYLSCYIFPEKEENIILDELKEYLAKKLPSYLLPSRYFFVNDLQLSLNGKLNLNEVKNRTCLKSLKQKNNQAVGAEQQLLNIWSSVLNISIKNINNNARFFELGGDSISSIILTNEINKFFNIEMDVSNLLLLDNFSSQLDYIQFLIKTKKNKKKLASKKIIPLNSPCERVVFLIHPIGGTLFWYLPMARQLNGQLYILGIQDPDLFSSNITLKSIDEMAEKYADYILSYSEKKSNYKFTIGGASFGGTVAIEIAKKLLTNGMKIERVLIFDGWAIYPEQLNDNEYFYKSMRRQQEDWLIKFNKIKSVFFDFNSIFKVQMQRLKMLFDYKPEKIPFHIDILKAEEIIQIFKEINEPTNHWGLWAKKYSVHILPGNHESMFARENVEFLSEKIKEIMKL